MSDGGAVTYTNGNSNLAFEADADYRLTNGNAAGLEQAGNSTSNGTALNFQRTTLGQGNDGNASNQQQSRNRLGSSRVAPSELMAKNDIESTPRMNTSRQEGKKKWKSFENMGAELPLTNLLQPPRLFYKLRWNLLKWFHTRVIDVWDYGITLGELILIPGVILAFSLFTSLSCCEYEATGSVAAWSIFFTFLFSSKNSLVTFISGVSYDRLLLLHKLFAVIAVVTSLVHGLAGEKEEEGEEDEHDRRVRRDGEHEDEDGAILTGWVFAGFIFAIVIFALYYIRKYFYEAFYRIHLILAIGIFVMSILHGSTISAFGVIFWTADFIMKLLIVLWNQKNSRKCLVKRLPCDVIQIKFSKGRFNYKSGQHVSILLPKVSLFEWHLFSISSAPDEDYVTIHLRVLGDWTKRFHDTLTATSEQELTVFINGPYGMSDVHNDDDCRLFMMISGGIGVTPLQSITSDLVSNSRDGRPIERIMFIWSVRDVHMIKAVLNFDHDYYDQQLPKSLPTSFQPDLLDQLRNEKSMCQLDTYYHITDVRKESQRDQGNVHPSIQSNLKMGRPHLSQYFERMFETAIREGESKVAVLCCGPSSMVAEALMFSSAWSKDGVTFDFYPELFEL